MTPPNIERGLYVNLCKTAEGDLRIERSEHGHKDFRVIEAVRDTQGSRAALFAMLEDHLLSGWEMIRPEEIAALTDAPILADDVERDDRGRLTAVGRVYWYPEYQLLDPIEELRERFEIVLQGVSSAE